MSRRHFRFLRSVPITLCGTVNRRISWAVNFWTDYSDTHRKR
jgi:hypothetical protein